ncbi:MAG: hypothetical protein LBS50_10795 [Prevotellaceae bacterium]|nr:hypothetical protein [Prevotellaceae bacterium]
MKKIVITVAVFATLALASCDKGPACWEVKTKTLGVQVSGTIAYFWGTEDDAEAKFPSIAGTGFDITKVSKSEADCKAADEELSGLGGE